MRAQSILFFASLALSALPASASDFLQSTYIGIAGGSLLGTNDKADFPAQSGMPALTFELERGIGFNVSLYAGKRLNEYLRVQADIGYLHSEYEKFQQIKIKAGGVSAFYASTSLYFDYSLTENFTPFLGIGAGLASFDIGELKNGDSAFSIGQINMEVQDTFTPFLKLNGGAAYKLTDNLSAIGEYSFMNSADFDYRGKDGPANLPNATTSFQSHIAQVGLRYNF
ncbi:outer membrane protein [Pseudovibrio sp. SCP19]|uniref:outer membrane protein n=1 Tax=Pseudovibrio sp. SCP19 TaxID=3141374 RepID=UPI00333991AA